MNKGRISPVLQQPPHQVRQQVAVRADRCVNAAGNLRVLEHFTKDAFAHAVQALQLERDGMT